MAREREREERVVDSDCCIINFTRGCFFAKLRRGPAVSAEFRERIFLLPFTRI